MDGTLIEAAARGDSAPPSAARLLSALGEGMRVRRRVEFFAWTQGPLQEIVGHGMLLCGLPRNSGGRMFFDYFYNVPIHPNVLARVCHPRNGLAAEMLEVWLAQGAEPLFIGPHGGAGARVRLAEELDRLGLGEAVVHGIPSAQMGVGAHCFLGFVGLTASSAHLPPLIEMLVPHVFNAYCRSLARDRPAGGEQAGVDAGDQVITDREIEILKWVREGKSNQEIGMILNISPLTVKNHVQKILRKLQATNRAQAVSKAISLRLLGPSYGGDGETAGEGRPRVETSRAAAGRSAGFTLLELLVVLVIIGLLAGFVAPHFFGQIGKSEQKVAVAQIDAFEKALDQFRLDVGRYPRTEEGLAALVVRPGDEPRWAGPYLRKGVPLDPWGRPYVYRYPSASGSFELFSAGKDGAQAAAGTPALR